MKNKRTVLLVLLVGVILAGCGTNEEQSSGSDDVLDIYTTIYPMEFLATEIGGEHVNVESIIPAGTDVHTYEPTSKTIIDIAESDAFIYNNEELETYAQSIKDAIEDEDVHMLEASNGITVMQHVHEDESEELAHEGETEEEHAAHEETDEEAAEETTEEEAHNHEHGELDPHIWLDPIATIDLAENVKEMLVELNPDAKADFEDNFEALKTELEELDQAFHQKIEASGKKEILVTHAAYGYWENAYGLEQIAISGISTADEPSQKQIERIIEAVEEHQINYLLVEQYAEPSFVKVIQNETALETSNIHNLETLTEENINNEDDYFSLMYRNLDVLTESLTE